MARYTYDDFTSAVTNAGMADQFDENDYRTAQTHPEYGLSLLSLKQDGAKASTAEQKMLIGSATEQLKNAYGLNSTAGTPATGTTTATGTNTATTPTTAATTPETQMRAGSFTSESSAPAQATGDTTAATNMGNTMYATALGDWSYDPATDRNYQAYRKAYLREADRSTANTLGQAAAMTAGRANSYAVNAAQQAGDYYRGQLADKVPELEQNAYQKYLNQYNAQDEERKQTYSNLITTISNTGYMPTEEELARAGMTEEEAIAWRKNWAFQAVVNRQISPEDYYKMFGEWPYGYGPQLGGDDYGGGGAGYGLYGRTTGTGNGKTLTQIALENLEGGGSNITAHNAVVQAVNGSNSGTYSQADYDAAHSAIGSYYSGKSNYANK